MAHITVGLIKGIGKILVDVEDAKLAEYMSNGVNQEDLEASIRRGYNLANTDSPLFDKVVVRTIEALKVVRAETLKVSSEIPKIEARLS